MYMPDEVFHDWKSIRIKEEKKKTRFPIKYSGALIYCWYIKFQIIEGMKYRKHTFLDYHLSA